MKKKKGSRPQCPKDVPDISPLESEFGVQLPAPYVKFLREFPADFDRVDPDYDQFEAVSELYLFKSPQRLREFNGEARDDEFEFADGKPWPKDYFVVGHDGCGNTYAIQCGKDAGRIVMWDGDEGAFEEIAKDMDAYARYIRDLIGLPQPDIRVSNRSESADAVRKAARAILDSIRPKRSKTKPSKKSQKSKTSVAKSKPGARGKSPKRKGK